MNEKVTSTTFALNQKINDIIKKTYNKSSYLIEGKSHSNEKYEYDNDNITYDFRRFVEEVEKTIVKSNATKVVDTLEEVMSNDVMKKEEIPLLLRFKLRRRNITIKKKKTSSIYDNY